MSGLTDMVDRELKYLREEIERGKILMTQAADVLAEVRQERDRLCEVNAEMRIVLRETLAHVGVPQENRDTRWHAAGNRIYRLTEQALISATPEAKP